MKITQAILPVAGLGTRFLPWTKAVAKELLPLGTQPIIAHLVDECLECGITDICFVISKGKESIPNYFKEDPAFTQEMEKRGKSEHLEELKRYNSVNFHVVYQDEQHGDGHAILQANEWIGNAPIAILFGDDMFVGADTGLRQLKNATEHAGEESVILALENVPPELVSSYGIVEVEEEHEKEPRLKKLKSLVEKPHPDEAPSTLGIVGRFVVPRSTIDVLPSIGAGHGGEIRLIDALISQLQTTPIFGYECEGKRLDTGTPEGYAEAVRIWHS